MGEPYSLYLQGLLPAGVFNPLNTAALNNNGNYRWRKSAWLQTHALLNYSCSGEIVNPPNKDKLQKTQEKKKTIHTNERNLFGNVEHNGSGALQIVESTLHGQKKKITVTT